MMEVADIVCSFPEHLPCVVLSAMGKVRARAVWSYLFMQATQRCSSLLGGIRIAVWEF